MAEVATVKPVASAQYLRVSIRGKIIRSRRFEEHIHTAIMCPAKDEFSKPQVVEVRSRRKIGEREDIITVECDLGGFERKAFQMRDAETGEVLRIIPVNHTLDVIEAA